MARVDIFSITFSVSNDSTNRFLFKVDYNNSEYTDVVLEGVYTVEISQSDSVGVVVLTVPSGANLPLNYRFHHFTGEILLEVYGYSAFINPVINPLRPYQGFVRFTLIRLDYAPLIAPGRFTATAGKEPGQVWLSWRIPVIPALPPPVKGIFRGLSGSDFPELQVWYEKAEVIHYEYRVLRDGSEDEWKRFNIEDTMLDIIDKDSDSWDHQRRKYLVTGLDRNSEYSFCIRAVNPVGTGPEACNTEKVYPVNTVVAELPGTVSLLQNYPNPFNPETVIDYVLPQAAHVRLAVYDMTGKTVAVLMDGIQPQGQHTARFNADGLPTGTYVYRLTAGSETLTRTMTLVR